MGDLYISEKYLELREKWGRNLDSHCTGLLKQRTLMNNYAPVYATLEYYHSAFRSDMLSFLDDANTNIIAFKNVHKLLHCLSNCFLQGMSMKKWVSHLPSLRNGWKTTTQSICRYCMWKLVSECMKNTTMINAD